MPLPFSLWKMNAKPKDNPQDQQEVLQQEVESSTKAKQFLSLCESPKAEMAADNYNSERQRDLGFLPLEIKFPSRITTLSKRCTNHRQLNIYRLTSLALLLSTDWAGTGKRRGQPKTESFGSETFSHTSCEMPTSMPESCPMAITRTRPLAKPLQTSRTRLRRCLIG